MSLSILGRSERLRHLLPEVADLRITGFQSPAEDEKEERLSLDKLTGLGAPQIWVVMVNADDLIGFGMYPGDRLVVDRSAACADGCFVVVEADGDDTLRVRLMSRDEQGRLMLKASHPFTPPVNLETDDCVAIWGVVRWVISYVGAA
ncbi:S24 family peptidase [Pseudomonas sp. PDM14]|uniref:LexA family protein n=1 Tax=Pseudomonas sp. PDM14 TaxID=2769288 RepID=UPI0017848859|nr:S24 family peptidase [Pseudomonas sp. PDM14]MBD9483889.1 S24 family peptidase [Pseudomonas sp. PDM14]